jgi:hypothetical protein
MPMLDLSLLAFNHTLRILQPLFVLSEQIKEDS